MSVMLSLLAALAYGIGDFVGGLGGRRSHAAAIPIMVQAVGVPAALVAALAWQLTGTSTAATWPVLVWGALSGLGSGTGNAALYRGLARGQMSVVAPTAAVLTALIPAAVGLATGDEITLLGWCGFALAAPALVLVSAAGGIRNVSWSDVAYGTVAGIGFGWLFVALDQAGTDAGAWPLVPGQGVAFILVVLVAGAELRRSRHGEQIRWRPVAAWGLPAGVLGAAANLLFLASTAIGALSVSSVLAALYPAVTVVLAAFLLHERLGRGRTVGLICAAVSVTLVVLGT